jgi:histidine phosphotransferase ChpT
VPALLAGFPDRGVVDAHAIQPFYTGLLGRASGLAVSIEADGDAIVLAARAITAPVSAAPAAPDAAASQNA